MAAKEEGKLYPVVFFGSTSVLPGVPLVGNTKYPSIAKDLTASYRTLRALPCEVFLAPHAGFFGLLDKAERLRRGEKPNPFIDPKSYREFIDSAERSFLKQLKEEQAKARQ